MVLTFRHAVQYHVNEDVGASPPCTITETGAVVDRLSRGAQQNEGGVEETWKFGLGTTLVGPLGWAREGASEPWVRERS